MQGGAGSRTVGKAAGRSAGDAGDGLLAEEVVAEDEPGHGFDDGDGAGEDAGIMPPFAAELHLLMLVVNGVLRDHEGGGGLEGEPHVDVFPIGDAALDAAGVVAAGADAVAVHIEGVVVPGAGVLRGGEAGADVKSLAGGDAHHGVGQGGFQLVEDGVAQPDGAVADGAGDDAAQRVAVLASLPNGVGHGGRCGGVGCVDDVAFDGGGVRFCGGDGADDVMHLGHPGQNLDIGAEGAHDGAGDGSGGNAADGFPRAGAAASGPGANAVFRIVTEIGMRGAVGVLHLVVGRGAVVFVADGEGNGGSQGEAVQHAAEDFHAVFFLAGGDDVALAGAAAIQFSLDVGRSEGDARRATVDDDAHSHAVGFSPCADSENGTEGA